MHEGLAFFLWMGVEFVLILTGKGVIAALSLGRWRGEKIRREEGRIYSAAGAFSFLKDGQRVITATGLFFAGLVFYIGLVVLLVILP